MAIRNGTRGALLGAMLAVGGCSESMAPPHTSRHVGALQYEGVGLLTGLGPNETQYPIIWSVEPAENAAYVPNAIEAPDTVEAGRAFTVSVHTVGLNGCWRAVDMDVSRSGRVIEFTPWDEESGADVCTQVLGILRHDATLSLNETGTWTLRAKGRLVRKDEARETPVTAERILVVR